MIIPYINYVKQLLLKNVIFAIDEKTVRRGKLLLCNHDEYYVKFVLQTNKNINKNYEVPYPYHVVGSDTQVTFSYKILDLCRGNEMKHAMVTGKTPASNCNKLHDKNLTITVIDS